MDKPKQKRDVGRETLEGIRELKRGESGRVRNVPTVAEGVTTAARGFIGSDQTPGNVAVNTKRLLRERSRRK